jgi:hypothetical protein
MQDLTPTLPQRNPVYKLDYVVKGSGKSANCYGLNSCLRPFYKGYRQISCMKWARKTAAKAGWRNTELIATVADGAYVSQKQFRV